MKPLITRSCLAIGLAVMIVATGPFSAEMGMTGVQLAAAEKEKPQKTRRVPTMSEQTYKKLSTAQEFIDLKEYQSALNVLDIMLQRSRRLNGNEIGQVN
ncbi:MAG: hypothetical protein ACC642_09670, partial [Pseudomonadales bacterium]